MKWKKLKYRGFNTHEEVLDFFNTYTQLEIFTIQAIYAGDYASFRGVDVYYYEWEEEL